MAHTTQRAISIPEPTNDVDSLWASVKALKEAVETMQGIRGTRAMVLQEHLEDVILDVEQTIIGGGGGTGATQLNELTDVNTSTPTDRNVLVADGVDFESRALVQADISDGTQSVSGLGVWRYRTETVTPPAAGQLRFNNVNISAATEFYLNETNDDGADVSTFLELMVQDGSVLYIQDRTNAANHVLIEISGSTDNGTYRTYGIQNVIEEGTEPSQNAQVILVASSSIYAVIEPGTTNLRLATWDSTAEKWTENSAASLNNFGLNLTSSSPGYTVTESDQGTDAKSAAFSQLSGIIAISTSDDVNAFGEYILRATRTGTAVNLVELHGDNIILKPDVDVQIEKDTLLTNDADLKFTDAGKVLFGDVAGGEFSLGFDGNQTLELLDVSGNNSTFYLGGIATIQVNAETNGNSVVNVGEATTLRGSNATGRINFYNEVSSVVQTATLSHELGVFWLNGNNAKVQINAGTGKSLETNVDSIKISEVATAPADEAGYGQIWVRDDVPNTLMFTDDDGTDIDLTLASSLPSNTTLDAIIRGTGSGWSEETAAKVTSAGAITALSYGGVLESNILDKSAAEIIANDWNWIDNIIQRAELLDYSVTNTVGTISSNAISLNYATSQSHSVDLEAATANVTVTIIGGPPTGKYGEMIVKIQQDSTADRTLTWAGGVFRWPGGLEIEPQTGADKITIYYLSTWDTGTNWFINGVEYDL